jgi:hypothetical protein
MTYLIGEMYLEGEAALVGDKEQGVILAPHLY